MTAVVYFAKAGAAVKVGYSRAPRLRLAALSTANPHRLELIGVVDGGRDVEREIHARLRHVRLRGEWFSDCAELRQCFAEYGGRALAEPAPRALAVRRVRASRPIGRAFVRRIMATARSWFPTLGGFAMATGSTERAARRYADGQRLPDAASLLKLVTSPVGVRLLEEITADLPAKTHAAVWAEYGKAAEQALAGKRDELKD